METYGKARRYTMSISAILASSAYQQDFGQLTSALSSNDLAGARQAGQSASSQFIGLPLPAPIKADLDSLATALESGNLKDAQTAFSSLVADLAAEYQHQQEDSVTINSLS
jgi:hypothetical protein